MTHGRIELIFVKLLNLCSAPLQTRFLIRLISAGFWGMPGSLQAPTGMDPAPSRDHNAQVMLWGKGFWDKKMQNSGKNSDEIEKFIKKRSLMSRARWKQGHKTLFKDSKFFSCNVLNLWSVLRAWELLWWQKMLLFSSSQYYTGKKKLKRGSTCAARGAAPGVTKSEKKICFNLNYL